MQERVRLQGSLWFRGPLSLFLSAHRMNQPSYHMNIAVLVVFDTHRIIKLLEMAKEEEAVCSIPAC